MARVLLVDDERVFRSSLAQRLMLRGYHVAEAGNGADAIQEIRRDHDIDVVILDFKMPGMKFEQVLQGIRNVRPGASVILLTAYGTRDFPGARACLQKPCDLEELIRTIEAIRTEEAGT